jgi:diaminopimelate epimerase
LKIAFEKYHGAGNDFIMIDGRRPDFHIPDAAIIARLCDRRSGIGADGLIIIRDSEKQDFKMLYYNSDGKEGTLCGNGGRCAVSFAARHGITGQSARLEAIDGIHKATISKSGIIHLEMNDVSDIQIFPDHYELDTGSPHYVQFVNNVGDLDVFRVGSGIRNNPQYGKEGINVNFVSETMDGLFVRTYERGVENETLSCGTGVVASALCAAYRSNTDKKSFLVRSPGGELKVSLERTGEKKFEKIVLSGPAIFVFKGELVL